MLCSVIRFARVGFALGFLGVATAGLGQAAKTSSEYPDSHVDIYGGYGYLHPENSYIFNEPYESVHNLNATGSVTGYLNHYLGVQIEGVYFSGAGEHIQINSACSGSRCDTNFYSVEAGPVVRFPLGPFIPFAHVLAGGVRANGPVLQPITWGTGLTGGLGFDYVLPWWQGRLAVRPIQADFLYSHIDYGSQRLPSRFLGGVGDEEDLKLSGGLVLRFGEPTTKQPLMLGCTAEPASIHPGDPITVTGSTLYLNPHKKADYTWIANGGKVTSNGSSATLDTTGMAPGQYTVSGKLSQGNHASEQASCAAPFVVHAFEPPSLTCTATPNTAVSGTTIMISTSGSSPQNRPLTYSYTTSAGQLTSSGPTATLATAGLGASDISIGCNVVDDMGQSAKSSTSVTITAQPVPVIPQTQNLCSLSFTRDHKRPERVDNEAKGCLDDIALTLNQQTDSKLVIVGNASPDEKPEAAAARAMNARQYLTAEKGVDRSRIELRVGDTSGRTTTDVLVPAGATYSDTNTQLFDEGSIHRHGPAYGTGGAGTVHRHKARKTPATAATAAAVQ